MGEVSNEPTMEDILSSIKKIISEDSAKALSAPRVRRPPARDEASHEAATGDSDDVLELTEMAMAPAAPSTEAALAADLPAAGDASLVSEASVSASKSALDQLSSLVVKPEVTGSDTLEGMVREMLRPMMKEWLDANLPRIVEAMVSREIARISGR